jgi:hypothetical protein
MFDHSAPNRIRKSTARSRLAVGGAMALALLLPASASAAGPQAPYLGSWYLSFPEVCASAPEEGGGLLTYTAREFIGLENRCRIVRTTRRGDATELAMACMGEGHPYKTREIVKVVDGRLHRTMKDEGKWATYTYERCPARPAR